MEKIITNSGFDSVNEFMIKLVIPVLLVCVLLFFATMILLPLPFFVPYLFLLAGVFFIFFYPYAIFERKKVDIHENIHLFITYAGTISTLHINRSMLFKKIAEKRKYGEISKTAEKILYFAKSWNLGFAKTCRKIARLSPSTIFADFLDRFAAVLDFGEDLETFLTEEQDAVMDDYETTYKQSLENIKLLEDVFISMTIAVAFAMAAALLLPLIMGISIMVVVRYALLGLIFMDLLLILMIKGFIPTDNLCHDLKVKDEGTKKIYHSLMVVGPISLVLTIFLLVWNRLPFLVSLAIGVTPLLLVGFYAVKEENAVFRRDKAFPAFIRALGGTIYTRQGGIISSLGALRVHDFGVLNPMMINLYRRLKLGSERFRSWFYFAAETGSNLINYFIHIFAESVYLGGNAEKIALIISKNFSRLISLRKLRFQLASGLRGALYGALLGFTVTVYMAVSITQMLADMFAAAFTRTQLQGEVASVVGSILPAIPAIDIVQVNLYIGLMVIIHALMSSIIIKMVDGGNRFAALFDFTIMLWIGAILSWGIPILSQWAFGSMLTVEGGAEGGEIPARELEYEEY
ncbi:archaellar assembly protein FlaJ [Candidatus Woesearchaeota archaeon]|nr:archaellar assembly protein FlaJ [Candidatus Woesearchaeota archaeon]